MMEGSTLAYLLNADGKNGVSVDSVSDVSPEVNTCFIDINIIHQVIAHLSR